MSEHEAIQPRPQFIKHHPDDRECPGCGGRATRGAKLCRDCRFPRPLIVQPDDPAIRYVALTRGYVAIVSACDYEWLMQWRWCVHRNPDGKYYAVRVAWVNKRRVFIQMHRFILGVTGSNVVADHIEPGQTLNNSRENIRVATPSQNQANKRSFTNVSGYKGGSRVKVRSKHQLFDGWRAEVLVNGKKYASKAFRETIDAARAYDALAVKHFGEFARINFPEEWPHRS